MYMINRAAVVVKPAQAFLDWLRQVDPSADLALTDLQLEPTIYLLPEYATDEEARAYLRERCGTIFEDQLNGWHRVASAWPTDRSFESFDRWFEYAFHSMLLDLCEDRLKHEED